MNKLLHSIISPYCHLILTVELVAYPGIFSRNVEATERPGVQRTSVELYFTMGQTKPLASGGVPHSAVAAESSKNAPTHPLSPKTTGSATDTQPKVDPSTSSDIKPEDKLKFGPKTDTSNISPTEQPSEGVNPAEGKKPTNGSHTPLNDDGPTKEIDPNKPPSGDSQGSSFAIVAIGFDKLTMKCRDKE